MRSAAAGPAASGSARGAALRRARFCVFAAASAGSCGAGAERAVRDPHEDCDGRLWASTCCTSKVGLVRHGDVQQLFHTSLGAALREAPAGLHAWPRAGRLASGESEPT
eukprot:scaffold9927_cov118-Isochrysis_galbana.AAC.7